MTIRFKPGSRLCQPLMMAALVTTGLVAVPRSATAEISPSAIAQASENLCPSPALSRVQSHTVTSGETLAAIADEYNLLPVTLLAMNPTVQDGPVAPGTLLRIPPFNGVEIVVPQGQTWQDLATTYRVRADVLFEVNGCPDNVPSRAFIPGVNWLLDASGTATSETNAASDPLTAYPLAEMATVIANYGWQPHPERDELVFSGGVTLEADQGTAVKAVGDGTIAYVGEQGELGTLVVVNHAQGFQTRYGQVLDPQIRAGDRVGAGQTLGTTTPYTEETSILYFEVRTNSTLGWVARNPGDFIPELAVK